MALYQWENFIGVENAEKKISDWVPEYGPRVISRKNGGFSDVVEFKILIDNPHTEVILVGPFNDWGKKNPSKYTFKHDEHHIFASISTDEIKHKDKYKFLVNGYYYQDPAGHYFDDEGNTIFWDFEHPTSYQQRYPFVDTINRSTRILQTDLPGLIVHWADSKGVCGRDRPKRD